MVIMLVVFIVLLSCMHAEHHQLITISLQSTSQGPTGKDLGVFGMEENNFQKMFSNLPMLGWSQCFINKISIVTQCT